MPTRSRVSWLKKDNERLSKAIRTGPSLRSRGRGKRQVSTGGKEGHARALALNRECVRSSGLYRGCKDSQENLNECHHKAVTGRRKEKERVGGLKTQKSSSGMKTVSRGEVELKKTIRRAPR